MMCFFTKGINNIFPTHEVCAVNHDPIPHEGDKHISIAKLFGEQQVYKSAKVIITHSQCFISYIEKKYHKENRTLYVPLGPQNIICGENKHIAYDKEKTNFLFFGRIEEYKGLDVLAEAYGLLREKTDQVSLHIAGNGDFRPYRDRYLN